MKKSLTNGTEAFNKQQEIKNQCLRNADTLKNEIKALLKENYNNYSKIAKELSLQEAITSGTHVLRAQSKNWTMKTIICPYDQQKDTNLGIPQAVVELTDSILRELPITWALFFLKEVVNAIPVGANLTRIWQQFALWLFNDTQYGIINHVQKEDHRQAITQIAKLCETNCQDRNKWTAAERLARSLDYDRNNDYCRKAAAEVAMFALIFYGGSGTDSQSGYYYLVQAMNLATEAIYTHVAKNQHIKIATQSSAELITKTMRGVLEQESLIDLSCDDDIDVAHKYVLQRKISRDMFKQLQNLVKKAVAIKRAQKLLELLRAAKITSDSN